MSEHEHKNTKKVWGLNRWVAWSAIIVAVPVAWSILWSAARNMVTYGSLPDRVEVIRTEMTNLVEQLRYDNDQQHIVLRQEMRQGFSELKRQIGQLPVIQARPGISPYGFLTTNDVILFSKEDIIPLSMVTCTNQPIYNAKLEN
jgi:hypothetical protein